MQQNNSIKRRFLCLSLRAALFYARMLRGDSSEWSKRKKYSKLRERDAENIGIAVWDTRITENGK